MLDLRVWKLYHYRVSATNDCTHLVNPTDNYVYVYKYALSRVHQYHDYHIALTEHLALV